MSCTECFSGYECEGIPRGKEAVVHGRNTYIAQPEDGCTVEGIIIIVPDAFGWQFVNNRILADHYALRGNYRVYLPEFMDGKGHRTHATLWNLVTLTVYRLLGTRMDDRCTRGLVPDEQCWSLAVEAVRQHQMGPNNCKC